MEKRFIQTTPMENILKVTYFNGQCLFLLPRLYFLGLFIVTVMYSNNSHCMLKWIRRVIGKMLHWQSMIFPISN